MVVPTLPVPGGVSAAGQYHRISGCEPMTATVERQVQPQYTDGFDSSQADSAADQTA